MAGVAAVLNHAPTPRAREGADGVRLLPMPNGGWLRPYPPRPEIVSGFKKTKRAALALLNEATPEAAERLLALTRSEDERVALAATVELLNRTLGRAGDLPQGQAAHKLDLARLAADEVAELMGHLAAIRRLQNLAAARAGGGTPG
jgi:hypothetical protein